MYDKGGRNSMSGLSPTIFGASSPLGNNIGGMLAGIGSTCTFPYRKTAGIWDNRLKETKTTADLGYKSYIKL